MAVMTPNLLTAGHAAVLFSPWGTEFGKTPAFDPKRRRMIEKSPEIVAFGRSF
jgi:hypothetical protein